MDTTRLYKALTIELERVARELSTGTPVDIDAIDETFFSLNCVADIVSDLRDCLNKLIEEKGD